MLKYYGHKCFEGLLYKCVKIYLCKSYISGLNGYVFLNVFAVEAYVASWIEIKLLVYMMHQKLVEAYVASWIEIRIFATNTQAMLVEAYVASWIEIPAPVVTRHLHPSRLT